MKTFIKYALGALVIAPLALGVASCDNELESAETTYITFDEVDSLVVSPNSPVLVADGTSQLSFLVTAYYKVTAKDSSILAYPYRTDRVPLDKITITSSEGKTITAQDVYTTTIDSDSLHFTASYGSMSSKKVSVKVRPASETVTYPKITVPVMFTAFYSTSSQNISQYATEETCKALLERANKVFSNQLYKAPAGADVGIEFIFKGLRRTLIETTQEGTGFVEYITAQMPNLASEAQESVAVWLVNSVPNALAGRCRPGYTTGASNAIDGLTLTTVASAAAITVPVPQYCGFAFSYRDMMGADLITSSYRFEQLLGLYYGLLPTSVSYSYLLNADNDTDYCSDTFPHLTLLTQTKRSYQEDYQFNSFNIMDKVSTASSITHEQAKRIRQVIATCLYRQQGQ